MYHKQRWIGPRVPAEPLLPPHRGGFITKHQLVYFTPYTVYIYVRDDNRRTKPSCKAEGKAGAQARDASARDPCLILHDGGGGVVSFE